MKKAVPFLVFFFVFLLAQNNVFAQVGFYLSELKGKRFHYVLDKESGQFRTYRFVDDGNGWATGVQEQYQPVNDPDEGLIYAPVYDEILTFTIEENESCGNCMVFLLEDDTRKYFVIDHIEGDFWIQETDAEFKNYGAKYTPFVMPQDAGSAGMIEVSATSQTDERHYIWPEEYEIGSWVVPGSNLTSSEFISASSVLPEDDNFDYLGEYALDDNPFTTWFSDPAGKSDYPAGETIVFKMEVVDETIWILNGMQYSTEDFENNSRVKTMTVVINDEEFATVELMDIMGAQQIILEGMSKFQQDGASVQIELRITEVYPGSEYPEVGITDIYSVQK